ncbi:MAG TPA: YidC/Oxa1 family membrane protein insertase [Thermomicrobiales bacterium]|nr:YidC/Oxa1 family membrane protein insertase [Thermomicrobiales bacterium]
MSLDALVHLPLAIPILDQYVRFLETVLEWIGDRVGSGGLAIIIFTIIVRTLILPVTIKSTKSMKAMQDVQPRIKELQKKHKGDRARIQQETMALYSAYGVNPVAGCLPALIQLPIFFGVYRAIHNLSVTDSGIWHGGFLWLDSLKSPDPWHILPIAAGLFQLMQTMMARPAGQGKPTDQQQQMMNTMMNIMPITVVLFGWNFAAGPVIYWVTQSIYGIIQQWFITGWGKINDFVPGLPELPEHKRLGYHAPKELTDEEIANAPTKPKGKMGTWWEGQMKQAQHISEERSKKGGEAVPAVATASNAPTPKKTSTAASRPYARNSPKGRMLAEQAKREAVIPDDPVDVEPEVEDAIAAPAPGETPARPKKAKR